MSSTYRVVEARRIEQYRLAAGAPTSVAQLSRGSFHGRTEVLLHPAVSISRRYANQILYETGQLPNNHFIFSFHSGASYFYSGGLRYCAGDVSSVKPGSPYTIMSCRGCRYTTISMEHALLRSSLSAAAQQKMQYLFDEDTRVRFSSDPGADQLVTLMHALFDRLADGSLKDSDEAQLESLRNQMIVHLDELLRGAKLNKIRLNARAKLFRKAVEYIDRVRDRALGVEEVANAVGTSRRNLEVTFAGSIELSPKEYINNLRLNRVRHALLTEAPASSTISYIAGRFGYVHMSNFSRAYQALFDELPSETVERRLPAPAEPA